MRALAVVILLLSSVLLAETQEAAYYRALKAEEAGNVALALETFEEALALPGPYTDEIREIVEDYNKALKMTDDEKSPWSFRFLGDLGIYGLRYREFGGVEDISEHGGDLFFSLTPFFDYSSGNWIHSFGAAVSGDWFLANDNMPALDTNDWKLTVGLEYSLVGKTILLDIGADLNIAQGEDVSPAFYGWLEKDFYRIEKHRFGIAGWGFYDADGPLSFALYGAWHRSSPYGWNAAVYLGARFEADSSVDYVGYLEAYEAANKQASNQDGRCNPEFDENCFDSPWNNNGYGFENQWNNFNNPMGTCLETYGQQCFGWSMEKIDSLYWAGREQDNRNSADSTNNSVVSVPVPRYFTKWIGPALRSRVSYKFKQNITLDAKLNLFYGFVLDGPDANYEDVGKFCITWGGMIYWKPGAITIYLGVEQLYKHLSLPAYYLGIFPKNTMLSELKTGIKWEL